MRAIGWVILALVGCHGHDHGHGGEHGHDHHEKKGHDHHEKKGHDDHHGEKGGGGHGHAHAEDATAFTHFSAHTELFVEVPPLVVGGEAELAAHFTRLSDFRPLTTGRVEVELSGGGDPERVRVDAPAVPGIFRPVLKPKRAGKRRLVLRVSDGDLNAEHDLGPIEVFATAEAAKKAKPPEAEESGEISFLKEQQWKMEFATADVTRRAVRPSFEAYGTLRPRADGEAHVTAPLAGRISAGAGFPRIGLEVERDGALTKIVPSLAEIGDVAALDKTLRQARIARRQAKQERERLEALLEGGAIPQRRVVDAQFAEAAAKAALDSAESRSRQARRARGASGRGNDGGFPVRAPLAGTLVSVAVPPGGFVRAGDPLFRIVDLDRLWLEVHVTETHVGHLEQIRGVWFEVEGYPQTFEVSADQVVTVGGVLDERTRTLPLVVAVPNAERRLRVGMFATVHVVTGAPREVVAVPAKAVVVEGGLPVVYVQTGGESYARHVVKLGERDGDWVEVVDGLEAGARVVTRGAYAVRLAAASGQLPAHGHAH